MAVTQPTRVPSGTPPQGGTGHAQHAERAKKSGKTGKAEKKDETEKPLKLSKCPTPEENRWWVKNNYLPRFETFFLHSYFVGLISERFLEQHSQKVALTVLKAMQNFIKVASGVNGVGRQRQDPTFHLSVLEDGLAPDIGERLAKSQAVGADWDGHYNLVAAQMQKSAADTHSPEPTGSKESKDSTDSAEPTEKA